ncbi:glycosyltransferase family 2 protein [Hahella sp. HN01]|uniref:glycosyltransferase family 2 protein n=1 Tax=Hahella sp. HN01 TaxID=2847262 RepID=UPI001C1F070B|nr:glycosyltransferase family 2 protein [Hahella sp. HN01]MBU6951597.1 glycosyltransferase family 2 protein [Hahella sp. HN01]
MHKLTATIITLNEASRIARCIESVQFADEVVVVDSGSTDDTCRIAQDMGCRVITQEWLGYGGQKQFAVDLASSDWVLCIDADEVVTSELAASIKQVMQRPDADAYSFPRRNYFLGEPLRYGEGYPDRSLRLFNRKKAGWTQDLVHEAVRCEGRIQKLEGDLNHFSEETISQYLAKQNKYTQIQAEDMFRRGKKVGLGKILVSPIIRFFKFYVIRRGFLDGMPGFVHIVIGCMNSFVKYVKLYELRSKNRD